MTGRHGSDEERFWPKVDQSGECWLWTAGMHPKGYGSYYYKGTMCHAHRAAYEITYGPIPDGLQVDHMCHNRACVRPDHLRLASNRINAQNRRGAQRNSASAVRGVSWKAESQKWVAQGNLAGKRKHLGYFSTIQEAEAAVIAWRRQFYPGSLKDQLHSPKALTA